MAILTKLKGVVGTICLALMMSNSYGQAFTENFDNVTTLTGSGWFLQNNSSPVGSTSWFQGNDAVFPSFNGASTAYIGANYNNTGNTGTISNWMLTPMRVLRNGDVLTFYTRQAVTTFADRLEVRMSTNGSSTNVGTLSSDVGDFTTLLLEINAAQTATGYPETWTQYTITVSGLGAPIQGRFAFRYFVTGAGLSGTSSDYIGIDNVVYTPNCAALAIVPATLPNVTVGTPYSQNFSLTQGFGAVTYAVTAGALPTGLTLVGGVLSGTPNTTGSYSFSITATDASTCATTTAYTMNVSCPTVAIAPTTVPDATAGTLYTQNITLSGSTATTINYAVTSGVLPTGISLTTTGLLGGNALVTGTFNFTVTATDQYGCSASQAYTLIVNCPTITLSPTTLPNGVVGTAYIDVITSSGGVGSVTFSTTGTLPPGISIDAAGFVTGTPTAPGTYNFDVTATDVNNCTGTNSYAMVIDCQPMSIDQTTVPGGTVNAAYSETLTQTGGIGTGTYTVSAGTLPAGISLTTAGVLSGTPTESGSFNIDVTFTDDNGCTAVQSLVLAIACQTITIDQTSQPDGTAGVAYAGTAMTQTGGIGTATFAVTSGALPAGITLNTDGTLTGTPTVVGTFTFEITGTDDNGCTSNAQSFTIDIDCGVVTIDQSVLPDAYYNTPYSESLTQTGGVGAVTYTVIGGALPPGITIDADGLVSGTPTVGPGIYTIDVQVEDANGCQSAVQTITFGTGWPLSITLTNFTARLVSKNDVVMNWEVQGLDGTEQFYAEHSTDGKTFSTIGMQRATKDQFSYTAVHTQTQGDNYYRLRTKLQNGKESYSKVARITSSEAAQQAILLPNVVLTDATLQVTATEAGNVLLRIVDMSGREVYKQTANVNAGSNSLPLNLQALPVATYTIQVVINNNTMIPVKFVKM